MAAKAAAKASSIIANSSECMTRAFTPPEICPVCGESVPRGALACPGCGADERAGWNADAALYDDLDLPEEAFADPPKPAPRRRAPRSRLWIGSVVVVLALLIISLIFQ